MYSLLLIHSTAICDNKRTLSVSRSDDNSFDCSHCVFFRSMQEGKWFLTCLWILIVVFGIRH